MSEQTIQQRRELAERMIREAQGNLEIARSVLRAVQIACPHPNGKKVTHTDYSGTSDTHFDCPDCGLHEFRY